MERNNLEETIKHRINKRLGKVDFSLLDGLEEFYIAGNSLTRRSPSDYDLFPINKTDFNLIEYHVPHTSTKNATTAFLDNCIIQLCEYHYDSLEELVESFDFAHIKVGAHIKLEGFEEIEIKEVYVSQDFINARSMETTFYTGSKYPLSSLFRINKYAKREDFSGRQYITEGLYILADILERGFKDYEDFKGQLDAVDLGLLPEEIDNLNSNVLLKVFNALEK